MAVKVFPQPISNKNPNPFPVGINITFSLSFVSLVPAAADRLLGEGGQKALPSVTGGL
jgi:hypothetical protein